MKAKLLFFVSVFVGSSLSQGTVITGDSINFGWQNQVVDGANSIAVGAENTVDFRSLALGWHNDASNNSMALGLSNVTTNYSMALGNSNFQSSDSIYSLIGGYGNTIAGASQYSAVLGYHNSLQGQDGSFIAGMENRMLFPSAKDGLGNVLLGEYNTLDLTAASGTHARSTVLIGYENSSSESKAYAIGVGNIGQQETVTLGTYAATVSNASLIVGTGTGSGRSNGLVVLKNGTVQIPSGVLQLGAEAALTSSSLATPLSQYLTQNSYVKNETQTSGALALGNGASAASNSTAIGVNASASGTSSLAIGLGVTANGYGETALGAFNQASVGASSSTWIATDPQFVVGNGSGSGSYSNALVILKNGRASFKNKYWSATTPTAVPTNATEASNGEALSVEGHAVINGNATLKGNTVLEGNVTLAQPQGDISMGVYQ
jgi:hypothetical protein